MVAEIQVKLVAEKFMSEFYFNRAQKPDQIARQLRDLGQYREAAHFAVFGEGEEAAEEVFDLTNNPSRQAGARCCTARLSAGCRCWSAGMWMST